MCYVNVPILHQEYNNDVLQRNTTMEGDQKMNEGGREVKIILKGIRIYYVHVPCTHRESKHHVLPTSINKENNLKK